jgi:hypothetical protein
LYILPASGHFADEIAYSAQTTVLTPTPTQYYLILEDDTGSVASYGYKIAASASAATFFAPSTTNGNPGNATALTSLPAAVVGNSIDTLTSNWFTITATAADVGKSVNVSILDNSTIDATIDVTNGTASLGGPGQDADTFTSSPIQAAGTYYVIVTSGTFSTPPYGPYDLLVLLQ